MSRPWRGREALLLGHSQMVGMLPFFQRLLHGDGVRVVHHHAQNGINVRQLQRDVRAGLRVVPRSVADELPLVIVGLSGNGAVVDPLELRTNMDWLRAEYPRALIAWLGHTITRTGTDADQQRAHAAALEARIVPERDGFLFVDMRVPSAPLASDRIHSTRAGYRQLAEHAWGQIVAASTEARASVWPALLVGAALGAAAILGGRAYLDKRRAERGEDR